MGFFDNFKDSPLNPFYMFQRDDPSKDANKYLNQIPGIGKQYYNPFIQQGQQAGNELQGEYGKLLNPTSFMDSIMKNYKLSPGATYQTEQLGKGIGATAAAGGYAGTPQHETEYGEMAHKIMSGDMQDYLSNALGIYGQGLGGEQNFYNKGYDASSALADLLGGKLSSQSGLAFKADSDRNADRSALMNAIMKAFSQGGGASAGGGAFSGATAAAA